MAAIIDKKHQHSYKKKRQSGAAIRIKQQEIFSPLLPIMTNEHIDEAIRGPNENDL